MYVEGGIGDPIHTYIHICSERPQRFYIRALQSSKNQSHSAIQQWLPVHPGRVFLVGEAGIVGLGDLDSISLTGLLTPGEGFGRFMCTTLDKTTNCLLLL